MNQKHKIVVDKVCDWFKSQIPNCTIEKEKRFKINLQKSGLNKPYFIVDIFVFNNDTNQSIGVECKSLTDSNNFRKLCAGVGQAYVLHRRFGLSYLAIEVNENMLPDNDAFKFYKRVALLPNVNDELGIGILLVSNRVVCVGEPKYKEPESVTLFSPMGDFASNSGSIVN